MIIHSPIISGSLTFADGATVTYPDGGNYSGSFSGSIQIASVQSHLIPDSSASYDLGSTAFPYRDVYVSSGTIKIGGIGISATSTGIDIKQVDGGASAKIGVSGFTLGGALGAGSGKDFNINSDGQLEITDEATGDGVNLVVGEIIFSGSNGIASMSLDSSGEVSTTKTDGTKANSNLSGSFTGSFTGDIVATNGVISGSAQVISSLPTGTVSGSAQTIANLPTGTVSGSEQLPGGIISGSSQLPGGLVSGSAQTIANLPTGTISGSVQILGATGIFSSSAQVGADSNDVGGHLIPSSHNTYDLGSSTKFWRDLYLSSGSLYINGIQVLSTDGTDLTIQTDAGESTKILETGNDTITLETANGDITLTSSGNGNIELDAPIQINAGKNILSSDGNAISFASDVNLGSNHIFAANLSGIVSSSAITYSGNNIDVAGNTTIQGNLTVQGTQTQLNTTTLNIEDKNLLIASGAADSAAANGGGITIDGANATITWVSADSNLEFNTTINVPATGLRINGTTVTSDATELNILDGADSDLNTLVLPANTTISAFGATLVDDADAAAARTTLGVDAAGTDNSTDVTLANTNYLSISGQVLTGGTVPVASGGTGATTAADARTNLGVDAAGTDNSTDVTLANTNYLSISGQEITGGTVPIGSGGTGATTAAAARSALGVDAAGTVNYTHPTHPGDDFSVDTGALTGATVVSDIDINVTTDTLGHVTDANGSVSTRTLTLADLGYTGATDANNYSHPTYAGDDISVDTGALTGATVISDLDFNITTDTNGHVTDANGTVSTRNLTLANLGYTGATDATNNTGTVTSVATGNGLTGGSITTSGTLSMSGTYSGTFAVTGAITATGDITAYASSDERLKDNIEVISNPIEKVQQLKGVTWDWNDNASEVQHSLPNVGVIAQDVEKVLPQLVRDNEGGYKAVDYDKIVGLLIEAIKDQQAQIDDLKSKI